jgi:hypothetical protein
VRVELEPRRLVTGPKTLHRLSGHLRRTWDRWHEPSVRITKFELAVAQPLDPVTFLVDRTVVTPAE